MPSQKAGVSLNATIPLDTIDIRGFSHHKGSHSLPATTSQGPAVASSASALLAAHHRTKETQYTYFPLIAGSCISRAQMQRCIWHSLVFSDKGIGRKVTIKGVVNSGWVREAQISKRFPSVELLCSCKIGENDLHREWQTTWKDLSFLRCSHHADTEHTWLALKVHSWLLEASQGQHWRCVSWTQLKSRQSANPMSFLSFTFTTLEVWCQY